jgi:hypothetical protein
MAKKLSEVTIDEMLAALPYLVKDDAEGTYIYNLTLEDTGDEVFVKLVDGTLETGKGHIDDPEAVLFTVKQGGMETLAAFQVFGMKAAMHAMMFGFITTSNIKKSEAWFQILEIGQEPLMKAFAESGLEVEYEELPVFMQLGLG